MPTRFNKIPKLLLLVTFVAGCSRPPVIGTLTPSAAGTATSFSTPLPLAATVPSPTVTPIPISIPTNNVVRDTAIIFIGETIPDGTNMNPGQGFIKIWTLKNGGAGTWVHGFALAKVSSDPAGEDLGSPDLIQLSREVKPGEELEVGVDLIAPQQDGRYTVYYQFQDENGQPLLNSQVWVTITVGGDISDGSVVGNVVASLTGFDQNGQYATVRFCLTLPDRNYGPGGGSVSLIVDQKTVLASSGASLSSGCFEFEFLVIGAELDQAQHVAVSIEEVRMLGGPNDPDGACQSARLTLIVQYQGLDFQCHFSMAGYDTNLQLPTGMTVIQAQQIIVDAIEGAIYAPWVLVIR